MDDYKVVIGTVGEERQIGQAGFKPQKDRSGIKVQLCLETKLWMLVMLSIHAEAIELPNLMNFDLYMQAMNNMQRPNKKCSNT